MLPNALLALVAGFLNTTDRLCFSSAHPHWRNLRGHTNVFDAKGQHVVRALAHIYPLAVRRVNVNLSPSIQRNPVDFDDVWTAIRQECPHMEAVSLIMEVIDWAEAGDAVMSLPNLKSFAVQSPGEPQWNLRYFRRVPKVPLVVSAALRDLSLEGLTLPTEWLLHLPITLEKLAVHVVGTAESAIAGLARFVKLRVLHWAEKADDDVLAVIGQLKALHTVRLYVPDVSNDGLRAVTTLPLLVHLQLDLADNPRKLGTAIRAATGLQTLVLRGLHLDRQARFWNMTHLQSLHVDTCHWGFLERLYSKLTCLHTLDLNLQFACPFAVVCLKHLPVLRNLTARCVKVASETMHTIAELRQVRYLWLLAAIETEYDKALPDKHNFGRLGHVRKFVCDAAVDLRAIEALARLARMRSITLPNLAADLVGFTPIVHLTARDLCFALGQWHRTRSTFHRGACTEHAQRGARWMKRFRKRVGV
jgi:tRNA (Thr-GGU) A37 N-methylase